MQIQCGSGLACDSGRSVNITVACAAVIAGKPAPTADITRVRDSGGSLGDHLATAPYACAPTRLR
ncbi:hypothetical protein F0169_24910 [Pseudomonas sp. MAFF 212408]|uniref:Uncharacterized protein n=1 Tax=Pseudomonas kitaguniensis TaxID=2607908 RepID=A0A5N7KS77_9PSED|nr:hypothetical protein [Pseudomonas kitaguniensis]